MKNCNLYQCNYHKVCINKKCDHFNPHERLHSCELSYCSYNLNDNVKCIINLKELRKKKLKKINERG